MPEKQPGAEPESTAGGSAPNTVPEPAPQAPAGKRRKVGLRQRIRTFLTRWAGSM